MHPVFFGMLNVYEEAMKQACCKPMSKSRKSGFTLMELLVYIAIVGIVVIVAGQAFSNSTKMRVRTQSMLKASEVAENVATLFRADVAQTGAKSSMEAGSVEGGDKFNPVNDSVFMHPVDLTDPNKIDSSSFSVTDESGFSNLKMRRMRYDDDGHYVAVEEVNWFVENGTLKRSCRTLLGTQDEDNCKSATAAASKNVAVEIATGITKFKIIPALPGVKAGDDAQVFPPCTGGSCSEEFRMVPRTGEADYVGTSISSTADHKAVSLSGFSTNYLKNTNDENKNGKLVNQVLASENADVAGSAWNGRCYKLTLNPQTEYELSFSLSDAGVFEKSRLFVPGRDLMSVGFRYTKDGTKPAELDDFFFYPPVDENSAGTRTMRFSVTKQLKSVCLAFTFVSYSPLAADGNVTISDLRLKKVESANYKFDYPEGSLTLKDKANVKAMRLVFGVQRNGEEGTDSLIVRIPSNGVKD